LVVAISSFLSYNSAMIPKIIQFVKNNNKEILLFLGVMLISSLSFTFGYITGKSEQKTPLQFENYLIEQNENS